MRLGVLVLTLWMSLSVPSVLFAEAEKTTDISQKLEALSKKIEEVKKQNQKILENQAKIFEELENLKIRIRRG